MSLKNIESQNYYDLLGIPPEADGDRIRDAYKELARIYHPDSNFYDEIAPGKASAEQVQIFKIITAAYNTLSDADKRREYDEKLRPLLNVRKNFKSWDDPDDDIMPARETQEIKDHADLGTRRMTCVFGRNIPENLSEDDNSEPYVGRAIFGTPAPIPNQGIPMPGLIAAGVLLGSLIGGLVYYLLQ